MKLSKHLPNVVLAVGITLTATAVATTVARSGATAGSRQKKAEGRLSPPTVISKVKTLEVVSVEIRGQEPDSQVIVELRNNSDKQIIAVTVESGDAKNASGVSVNGFKDGEEPPEVILEPYGTIKVEIPLSYVKPNMPIRVGGVMYADGSDEGDKLDVDTLRGQREHYKTKKQ